MATGNEDQIIRPGAGFFLGSMFPGFNYSTDYFKGNEGKQILANMNPAFDPTISAGAMQRAQAGQWFNPNDPSSGGGVAGRNFLDLVGQLNAQRDVVGTDQEFAAHPEGNYGWLKESGKWLGFNPDTGSVASNGALGTINSALSSNYNGRAPLIGSDVGQTWGLVRQLYDATPRASEDPEGTVNNLLANYRGNWESSGSNPQGDWWTGQTRANTDRQGPAGTWSNNLGQTHASRIYGVEDTGPQQDSIGQRGLAQTQLLTNPYEQQLLNDIDTENGINLANQLTDTRRLLGSAGLGASGAGQRVMADTYRSAQEQGQRDKMRTMADIRDRNIQRQAEAIRQGTDIGATAASERKARLADANTLWTQLAQQGRTTEQAQDYDAFMRGQLQRQGWLQSLSERGFDLGGQLYQQQNQNDLTRLGLDADMIKAANEAQQGWQAMENQNKLAGLGANAQFWQLSNAMKDRAYGNLQNYGDLNRQLEQQRANMMMQYSGMPLETLLKIATGIQSSPSQNYQSPSFGRQIGMAAATGAASDFGKSIFGSPYGG